MKTCQRLGVDNGPTGCNFRFTNGPFTIVGGLDMILLLILQFLCFGIIYNNSLAGVIIIRMVQIKLVNFKFVIVYVSLTETHNLLLFGCLTGTNKDYLNIWWHFSQCNVNPIRPSKSLFIIFTKMFTVKMLSQCVFTLHRRSQGYKQD